MPRPQWLIMLTTEDGVEVAFRAVDIIAIESKDQRISVRVKPDLIYHFPATPALWRDLVKALTGSAHD